MKKGKNRDSSNQEEKENHWQESDKIDKRGNIDKEGMLTVKIGEIVFGKRSK